MRAIVAKGDVKVAVGIGSGRTIKILVTALALVLLPSPRVHATHGSDGRSISGRSPFTCNPLDNRNEATYHLEFAPRVAVNPSDPDEIAVAWIQDGFNGIVVGFTKDRGDTWEKSIPPLSGHCSGATEISITNPHLSFGAKGRLYLMYCACLPHEEQPTRVAVQVSADGGASWSQPVSLEETVPVDLEPVDWSWVVADPTQPDTVYTAWHTLDKSDPSKDFNHTEMRFARSIDGGTTWTDPRDISLAPPGRSRWFPRIVALPDGSLVTIFLEIPDCPFGRCPPLDTVPVLAIRSTDQGDTWSDPSEVAMRDRFFTFGNGDPRVTPLVGSWPVEPPAVSRDGTIYYAWSSIAPDDSTPRKSDCVCKIYLTSSSDGGLTWSAATVVRASDVPLASPAVAAVGGRAGVLFYDFRNDVADDDPHDDCTDLEDEDRATADVWFISGPSGAPQSWKETHVAGPFDVCKVPIRSNDSIGSNQSIAEMPGGFASATTVGDGPELPTAGRTDIFFSRFRM